MTRLFLRLAWRSLRYRPATSILLLVAMISMTSTLTLALSVAQAARSPWDRTFAATAGADVIANSEDPARLAVLARDPRVRAAIGPFRLVQGVATVNGWAVPLVFVGRPALASPIDQPLLVAGSPDLSPNGVVLDRDVADAVDARVGDTLTVNGVTLTVTGIALSVAQPDFPRYEPGQAWTTPATVQRLAPQDTPVVHRLELQLRDPSLAPAFVADHADPRVYLRAWQQTRDQSLQDVTTIRIILLTVSALIAILVIASVTVLVGSRLNQQLRGFVTLKASGATPNQIVGLLLLEQSLIGATAVALGLAAGTWLATVLSSPGADLIGTSAPPALTPLPILVTVAATTAVLTIASFRAVLSLRRTDTITGLAPTVRQPNPARPHIRAQRTSRPLPWPLTVRLGLRFLTRRRARAAMTVLSVALSVALVVAALATQRTLEVQLAHSSADATGTALQTIADRHAADRIRYLVDLFAILFTTLGLVNLASTASFAARDAAPAQAVLRAVGATTAQTTTSLLTTQTVLAGIAATVGIPTGLALFQAVYAATNTGSTPAINPTAASLILVAITTVILAALLTAAPSRWLAHQPIAATLTSD
ncbi:MAG TPA: FtsX-like permease family protein [Nakamurella sp.]